MKTVFSGNPAWKRAESALERYNDLYDSGDEEAFNEYIALSVFFQALFVSDNGYVIDTGNFQTVNREILEDILKRVKKHPRLWKKFMVC